MPTFTDMNKELIMRKLFLGLGLCSAIMMSGGMLSAQEDNVPKPGIYHYQRVDLFRKLPVRKGATIFLGNSITDFCEWDELLGKRVLNRGISSDITYWVLDRLDEVVRHQPKKVFLLIGTNDLNRGIKREVVRDNILRIVSEIKKHSPKTKVYVQSILPTNKAFTHHVGHVKQRPNADWVNVELEQLATKHGYTYIDISTPMQDSEGQLKTEYTNDGLHLFGDAYKLWAEIIKKYL